MRRSFRRTPLKNVQNQMAGVPSNSSNLSAVKPAIGSQTLQTEDKNFPCIIVDGVTAVWSVSNVPEIVQDEKENKVTEAILSRTAPENTIQNSFNEESHFKIGSEEEESVDCPDMLRLKCPLLPQCGTKAADDETVEYAQSDKCSSSQLEPVQLGPVVIRNELQTVCPHITDNQVTNFAFIEDRPCNILHCDHKTLQGASFGIENTAESVNQKFSEAYIHLQFADDTENNISMLPNEQSFPTREVGLSENIFSCNREFNKCSDAEWNRVADSYIALSESDLPHSVLSDLLAVKDESPALHQEDNENSYLSFPICALFEKPHLSNGLNGPISNSFPQSINENQNCTFYKLEFSPLPSNPGEDELVGASHTLTEVISESGVFHMPVSLNEEYYCRPSGVASYLKGNEKQEEGDTNLFLCEQNKTLSLTNNTPLSSPLSSVKIEPDFPSHLLAEENDRQSFQDQVSSIPDQLFADHQHSRPVVVGKEFLSFPSDCETMVNLPIISESPCSKCGTEEIFYQTDNQMLDTSTPCNSVRFNTVKKHQSDCLPQRNSINSLKIPTDEDKRLTVATSEHTRCTVESNTPSSEKGLHTVEAEIMMLPLHEQDISTSVSSVKLSNNVNVTPPSMRDHSMKTSEHFEREFCTTDSSTNTDCLLWSQPKENLLLLSQSELVRRLESMMIVSEILSQQIVEAKGSFFSAVQGEPSNLRDKCIQTDHTEFSECEQQYRQLYIRSMNEVKDLELDKEDLVGLLQEMLNVQQEMCLLKFNTSNAVTSLNEICDFACEDYKTMVNQIAQMKIFQDNMLTLIENLKEKMQKNLHHREEMKHMMEDATQDKEKAYRFAEDLQSRTADHIRELSLDIDSYRNLLQTLSSTHKEQVCLINEHTESVQATHKMYASMKEDQYKMQLQMSSARNLLQDVLPLLSELNDKTQTSIRECDKMKRDMENIMYEKQQIQSELDEAKNQNTDLQVEVTVWKSEVKVLRDKLCTVEEDLYQVASNLSHAVSEKMELKEELTKIEEKMMAAMEESRHENAALKVATDKCKALSAFNQDLQQEQVIHLDQIEDLKKNIQALKELNEFILQENQLYREQTAETEVLLKSHLQALRERNLDCEELKETISELRTSQDALQEELLKEKENSQAVLLQIDQKICSSSLEIQNQQEKLQKLTDSLQVLLKRQKHHSPVRMGTPQHYAMTPRPSANTFLGSILEAISGLPPEETDETDTTLPESNEQSTDGLSSGNSAFTRVLPAAVTREENTVVIPETPQKKLEDSIGYLDSTVSTLLTTVIQVQEEKRKQEDELHQTIANLQTEECKLLSEISSLREEVENLQGKLKGVNEVLKVKAEVEKQLLKRCKDYEEAQQLYYNQTVETMSLQREMTQLKHFLNLAEAESKVLHEELSKGQEQRCHENLWIEEKIFLNREVKKLTDRLMEAEESKKNILARALRHREIYEKNYQKSQNELKILDDILEKVRKLVSSVPDAVLQSCQQLIELKHHID
ncbi:sperm-associated antigen 5 isoform X2 [Erpetoichthys calabaricus]|uniref:sperm-associated antigen 5 isoform X2 n=1 Tax=Erpetoichthys calabaricus TaxID=27687 RepID=UPI00223465F7|nr:sperm-associated antigen 5 isoform X2 [Erpetoichthys calabaricus]